MPAIGRAQEMEKAGNSKLAYYCYLYAVIKACWPLVMLAAWIQLIAEDQMVWAATRPRFVLERSVHVSHSLMQPAGCCAGLLAEFLTNCRVWT